MVDEDVIVLALYEVTYLAVMYVMEKDDWAASIAVEVS